MNNTKTEELESKDIPKILDDIIDSEIENSHINKAVFNQFSPLDKYFACVSKPSLNVIAGRHSTGKTSFMLNLFYNISKAFKEDAEAKNTEPKKVLYVDSGTNFKNIRKYNESAGRRNELGAIFIDSFDNIAFAGSENQDELNEVIYDLMVKLKHLSSDLSIPIFMTTQITEDSYKNINPYPKFHLLKGDGGIEECSDLVLFFERDDFDLDVAKNKCSVFIEKNRFGKTGEVELYFDKETNKFSDLSKTEQN